MNLRLKATNLWLEIKNPVNRYVLSLLVCSTFLAPVFGGAVFLGFVSLITSIAIVFGLPFAVFLLSYLVPDAGSG
jgi:hypothetical protein